MRTYLVLAAGALCSATVLTDGAAIGPSEELAGGATHFAAQVPPWYVDDPTDTFGYLTAGSYGLCGGVAPDTTSCTSGTYSTLYGGLGHSIRGGFTGTAESRLVWSGGVRVFACTLVQVPPTCVASGSFPPPNTPFRQECSANGVGVWRCAVGTDDAFLLG